MDSRGAAPHAVATTTEPASCSIYSTEHQFTLAGTLKFEIKSLLGRWFLNRPPPVVPGGSQLLNLGCGENLPAGFVNADFFRLQKPAPTKNFWGLDLRYALNAPNDHWDGVFTEHTLEHLQPARVLALLVEIHRTLKPGCWVRIVVPDLARYVDYYVGRPSHEAFSCWRLRGAALRSVAQNYLHLSLWDAELLSDCLKKAGFATVAPRAFRVGADARLLVDTPEREYESLYLEGQKAA